MSRRDRTDPRRRHALALRRLRQPDPLRRHPHRRTTEYWHFDLAGEHPSRRPRSKAETVESVTCRWCGRSDAIELVDRAAAAGATDPAAD